MKSLIIGAALLFAQSEPQTTVIRSIKYDGFKGVSVDEMAHRLKDRGVRVALEQYYEPQQVESARKVLQELLEEKGRQGSGSEERCKADSAALRRGNVSRSEELNFAGLFLARLQLLRAFTHARPRVHAASCDQEIGHFVVSRSATARVQVFEALLSPSGHSAMTHAVAGK